MSTGKHQQAYEFRILKYSLLAAVVLMAVAVVVSAYMLLDLRSSVSVLNKELERLESDYERMVVSGVEDTVTEIKRRLQTDLQKQQEVMRGLERESRALIEQTLQKENVPEDYSFEIVLLTEKKLEDGQQVIYTKKSLLAEALLGLSGKTIVSTSSFPVWDNEYLLIIYKQEPEPAPESAPVSPAPTPTPTPLPLTEVPGSVE